MNVHPGESTILEIGVNYLDELCPSLGPEIKMPLIHSMSTYLSNQTSYEVSQQAFFSIIGRSEPLDRLKEIVEMPEEPLNLGDLDEEDPSNLRKKTRSWTQQEDIRLLAGIYRYGVDNWTTISVFIGNGRTRAQCCQRWTRGLNPRISKNLWSYEEDLRLVQLVNTYGDKSWTKIASMMGNRSDVQCRYHYHQVMRDMPPLFKKSLNLLANENGRQMNPEFEQIRTAIEAQLPARYSLPQFNLMPSEQIYTPPEPIQQMNAMRPVLSQPTFGDSMNPLPAAAPKPPQSNHQRRASLLPLPGDKKTKFPPPPTDLETSFSGSAEIDRFLKDFE